MKTLERRQVSASFEVRDEGETVGVRGYAAVFDSPSHGELVRPTAFNKTLRDGADVRLLVNHDGVPLARTKSGTLHLSTDDRGLIVDAPNLDPSNPDVARIRSAMSRGDIDQMSFAFEAVKDPVVEGVRELQEVRLWDVSIVAYPWYEDTTVSLKSLDDALIAVREGRKLTVEQRSLLMSKIEKRGSSLGALIARLRDENELDNETIASAGGIAASTLGQIIAGEINCPPRARLEGFADALGVSASRLISAAEEDGCDYSSRSDGQPEQNSSRSTPCGCSERDELVAARHMFPKL